ncbi:MAG: hypothetical protein AAF662_14455 [Pseudomonadota bacterium]
MSAELFPKPESVRLSKNQWHPWSVPLPLVLLPLVLSPQLKVSKDKVVIRHKYFTELKRKPLSENLF